MKLPHARWLMGLGLAGTLAFALHARRHDLAEFDWRLPPATVAAAVALLALPGLVQAATFVFALRGTGAEADLRPALRAWARSWLLRYEPSGAVGFAYRVGVRERLGASTPQVLTATAYEQLAAVVGGAIVAPLGFVVAGLRPPMAAVVAALVTLLAAVALAIAVRVAGFAGEVLAAAAAEAVALLVRPRAAARAAGIAAIAEVDRTGVIVVVPTYQEAEALPLFAERFAATGLELLIVDDASPDGTGAIADALAAARPWMHVLHRDGKEGLGLAYRAGFAWCLERGYRAIGQMDCDLSHPPEKLPEMLAVLDGRGADLVIANRYLPGGGTANWSRARRALSRIGCTASRLLLGLPYADLSGGFKLWRASCLADLDLDAMLAAGYAFQIETTQLAHLLGKRIAEVPFVFSERVAGASKMTPAITWEGIGVCVRLRRRARALGAS